MARKVTKIVINWREVQRIVNKRLGADHAINYLQNIWGGNLKSSKIMMELQRLDLPREGA